MEPARRARWIRKPLIALAATGFALLLAELGFRLAHVSVGTLSINRQTIELSDDPRLLYQLRPGGVARAEVDYRINSLGMRGGPVEARKEDGVLRILVLGDSIPFGYWVAAEDALPAQLETMLTQHGRGQRFEVLNLGVPGYNLDQSLRSLQVNAPALDPDLAILSICMNDLESIHSYEYGLVRDRRAKRGELGWLGRLWDAALDHSVICAWIEYRRSELEARREYIRQAGRGPPVGDPPPELEQALAGAMAQRFEAAAGLLAEADVPGLVVVFPTVECSQALYRNDWIHDIVGAEARRAGLELVDLRDCLGGYASRDAFVDPIHPTPLGHRVAAHAVLEYLARSDLLGVELDTSGLGDCGDYDPSDFPRVRGY